MRAAIIITLFSVSVALSAGRAQSTTCSDMATCRQLALTAARQSDFVAFQTFAWRAMQAAPRNDPEMLYLVAQAQALNGRPHDALVMLRRLAEMGVAATAAESAAEFRRARALADWPAVQTAIQAAARSGRLLNVDYTLPADAVSTSTPELPPAPVAKDIPAPAPTPIPATTSEPAPRAPAPRFDAIAMAYDAVSARFVLADQRSHTLKVLDDLAGNVVDLVGRGWSGGYETSALAIDARRGDLWVVGQDAGAKSALHRLQLISGRLINTIQLPDQSGAARFTDIVVTESGQVFVLDAAGQRLYRSGRASKGLTLHMKLDVAAPTSLTLADGDTIYVAHPEGILRVNITSRRSEALKVVDGIDVANLQRLGWHNRSLLGIQKASDATFNAVRITLDASGRTATRLETLEPASSPAASVANGVFYYFGVSADNGSVVRRVKLQ